MENICRRTLSSSSSSSGRRSPLLAPCEQLSGHVPQSAPQRGGGLVLDRSRSLLHQLPPRKVGSAPGGWTGCFLREGRGRRGAAASPRTHQTLQDPPALGVAAVVRQDPSVDQNQAVQEHPGAKPEQGQDQGPLTGPHPQAQPAQQRRCAASTSSSSTRQQTAGEHGCCEASEKTAPQDGKQSPRNIRRKLPGRSEKKTCSGAPKLP